MAVSRLNIAIGGGPCTGKSTLAARVFSTLKETGLDYDLVNEESRKLKREFGQCRSPFERFYLWRQQEREELRSMAINGFVTDSPLFQLYVAARVYASESRDELAVRELFRLCLESCSRYKLIVIAERFDEIPYRNDQSRASGAVIAEQKHHLITTFVDHFWPERLVRVSGNVETRTATVLERLRQLQNTTG